MTAGYESHEQREQLITIIRSQAAAGECWERAEAVMRAGALRERLRAIDISPTPDVAAAIMAVAMFLAAGSDEWGGDYRDALGDVAAVGLALFDS